MVAIAALVPDFRVTKLRVPVKVWVADKVHGGDVFLTPVAASHDGGETLSDVLNGRDPFLPMERDGCLSCYPLDAISTHVASIALESEAVPLRPRLKAVARRSRRAQPLS